MLVGAYSTWALIRGWALIRINTALDMQPVKTDQMNTNQNTKTCQTRLNLLLLNNGADKSWS